MTRIRHRGAAKTFSTCIRNRPERHLTGLSIRSGDALSCTIRHAHTKAAQKLAFAPLSGSAARLYVARADGRYHDHHDPRDNRGGKILPERGEGPRDNAPHRPKGDA